MTPLEYDTERKRIKDRIDTEMADLKKSVEDVIGSGAAPEMTINASDETKVMMLEDLERIQREANTIVGSTPWPAPKAAPLR